jgi:periplasmic protein TonB
MPAWIPANVDGVAVRFRQSLSISCVNTKSELQDPKIFEKMEVEVIKEKIETPPISNEKTFSFVESMPSFPGGEAAMFKFINDNLKYPEEAKENKIEGKVFVSFIVDTDGSIQDVKVKRGIVSGCNEEAIRLVSSMPKWVPGKQNGKAVRVSFNLPVVFRLQ